MGYAVTMTSPAHTMLRKLPPPIRKHLVKKAQKLSANPNLGQPLRGILRGFLSLHTVYRRTHYRIVYEINQRLEEIIVRGAGPRENLYRKLERMHLKPLS
jgi:mRNA-degrading endonuclease RelE of RelBE toxin-antitoxin system